MPPYEITFSLTEIANSDFFPKIHFFGNAFPYPDDFLLKTKMVRMVRRNILYSVDLEICREKSELGRKSKKWHFRKWRGGEWKWRFWDSKWGVSGSFQRRKYSKIYSGLIRHHPGSIFIYKIIFPKKNNRKSIKIDKNPSLLSALAGAMVATLPALALQVGLPLALFLAECILVA